MFCRCSRVHLFLRGCHPSSGSLSGRGIEPWPARPIPHTQLLNVHILPEVVNGSQLVNDASFETMEEGVNITVRGSFPWELRAYMHAQGGGMCTCVCF